MVLEAGEKSKGSETLKEITPATLEMLGGCPSGEIRVIFEPNGKGYIGVSQALASSSKPALHKATSISGFRPFLVLHEITDYISLPAIFSKPHFVLVLTCPNNLRTSVSNCWQPPNSTHFFKKPLPPHPTWATGTFTRSYPKHLLSHPINYGLSIKCFGGIHLNRLADTSKSLLKWDFIEDQSAVLCSSPSLPTYTSKAPTHTSPF
jgi:hypothetical protein